MKETGLRRWEAARGQGLLSFIVRFGIVKVGIPFLILEIILLPVGFLEIRRILREGGSSTELSLSSYLATWLKFVPRMILIPVVAGVLFGVAMWIVMELLYRRAARRA